MPKRRQLLEVGAPAPPLVLPSVQGKTFSLEIYRNISPVIVWFSRGFSCPFCLQYMARLRLAYPKFRAQGAEILQIAPNPLPRAKAYFSTHKLYFPYLCDERLSTYKQYGVEDRGVLQALGFDAISGVRGMLTQPLGYMETLWADWMGRDILNRLGYHLTVAIEQGLFIIDRRGIIRYMQIIGPIGNIPGNEELLRELEKIGN